MKNALSPFLVSHSKVPKSWFFQLNSCLSLNNSAPDNYHSEIRGSAGERFFQVYQNSTLELFPQTHIYHQTVPNVPPVVLVQWYLYHQLRNADLYHTLTYRKSLDLRDELLVFEWLAYYQYMESILQIYLQCPGCCCSLSRATQSPMTFFEKCSSKY